jgi:hypothetical protein
MKQQPKALPADLGPAVSNIEAPPVSSSLTFRQKLYLIAVGVSGTLALGSGFYLYQQGRHLWEKAKATLSTSAALTIEPLPAERVPTAYQPKSSIKQVENGAAPAPVPGRMESAVTENAGTSYRLGARLRPINENVVLRNGPGMDYSVHGLANENDIFLVQSERGSWLHVTREQDLAKGVFSRAWVRTDQVTQAH